MSKVKRLKAAKNIRMVECDKIYDCYDLTGIKNVAEGYVAYVKGSSDTRYTGKKMNGMYAGIRRLLIFI